mmetsp:Transcript_18991/g.33971  ORF Transcript_18991/g.33971 Transcript_18991/m.33971 type:complete len:142 (-) Transcript_18991:132-557(-)
MDRLVEVVRMLWTLEIVKLGKIAVHLPPEAVWKIDPVASLVHSLTNRDVVSMHNNMISVGPGFSMLAPSVMAWRPNKRVEIFLQTCINAVGIMETPVERFWDAMFRYHKFRQIALNLVSSEVFDELIVDDSSKDDKPDASC